MTDLLGVLIGALTVGIVVIPMLKEERARVADLLTLLEAKAAPAEHAAYIAPSGPTPPDETYMFSDDGLIGVRTEDPEIHG